MKSYGVRMKLIHKNGSLFDAPTGSVLAHACNGMGVWGSGIAKEFKKKFPESYKQYYKFCMVENIFGGDCTSLTEICQPENGYSVACMITSLGYGAAVGSKTTILENSKFAIHDLLDQLELEGITEVHSNKFNSGLFGVPWEETETVLLNVLKNYPAITWNVWTPNEDKE